MSKDKILAFLETAVDKNGDIPMRLVRQAFEKLPEPCEDAVSRESILLILRENYRRLGLTDKAFMELCSLMKSEPSVTPKRKTGKWIDDGSEFGLCCSECETTFDDYFEGDQEEVQLIKIPKYCPNCGSYNSLQNFWTIFR